MPLHGFLTALLLALLALLAGNGCSDAQFTLTTDFAEKHAFEANRPFAVDWTNGRVDVEIDPAVTEITADGQLRARATSTERARELLDQSKIEFVKTDGRVILRLKSPKAWGGGVSADVKVRLPAGTPIEIDSVNGSIDVKGNSAPLSVDSTNGRIDIADQRGPTEVDTTNGAVTIQSLSGSVLASTTNGEVVIHAAPTGEDRIKVHAVNGRISIHVPESIAATLDVSTVNGGIRLDPGDAKVSDSSSQRNRLAAKLNGGGCPIEVQTNNGQVTISCGRAAGGKQ